MYRRLLVALLAGLTFSTAPLARAAIQIDFQFVSDPVPNNLSTAAKIRFNGATHTITFPEATGPTGGFDFIIAGASDPGLVGLKGRIDGTFVASGISNNFAALTSSVSDPGKFSITDHSGFVLAADLSFDSIQRLGTAFSLNAEGLSNLSNVSYAGTESALTSFRDGSGQSVTLSGAFIPAKTLTTLLNTNAVNTTTYAGSAVAQVPEPSSLILMTCGVLTLVGWSTMRRRT
jgi:hypothetical protein